DLTGNVPAVGPAEHAHGELGASGAHEPGDAPNLAAAHVHVDTLDHLPVGMDGVIDAPVLHLEDHVADFGMARREAVVEGTPHHRGDYAVFADVVAVQRLYGLAVANDRHVVGNPAHLVEL